jgi:hypothetical protein
MTMPDRPDADQVADLLLPLDSPYPSERVLEAARTVAELVRRLNHATFGRAALRYPPQLYRAVGALRSGVYGLQQTFTQLAARLDTFATDPRVGHDNRHDLATACTDAAAQLRLAAAALGIVTAHLDQAHETTSHLSYTTTDRRRHGPSVQLPAGQVPSPPAAPPHPPNPPARSRTR